MGCANSKLDDLPAVALCKDRLSYLDQTLHQRYAFAEAHVAYIHSLKSVGESLHRFFDASGGLPTSSPLLNLPPHRKSNAAPAAVEASGSPLPSGNKPDDSGHLHFHSGEDSDEDGSLSDGSGSLHHESPLHDMYPNQNGFNPYPNPNGFNPHHGGGGGGGGYVHMNYMRRHVTPSVSYQQKPVSAETVQFGEASSSAYNNYPAHQFYAPQQSNNSSSYYDYGANYGNPYGYTSYGGGFFGAPATHMPPPVARGVEGNWGSSSSKQTAPPPPPPPPPSTSAWDFLNPFESIESSYPPYTPSRDSREVREEEGIPDLEDEDFEHEVVKEVHGRQKLVDDNNVGKGNGGGGGGGDVKRDSKRVENDDVGPSEGVGDSFHNQRRSASSPESTPVEYEVHMVDKTVAGEQENQGKGGQPVFLNVSEVLREIQVQFGRASAAGSELDKVLEVGKLRYQRKHAAYQVSSKMLCASLPSSSKDHEVSLDRDEEVQLKSMNLSATLQKLYLWEKKLFEEVKVEEKMRVQHDKKLQKWKKYEEKGAEPHKIDALRSEVRSLSTKIRIAIQIVDRISEKINKLRDEELWPLLNELLQGLRRMWKAMLECHHSQCRAVDAARGLDALAFPQNPSDTQLEASLQLEHDLINWTYKFTDWVGSQKGFVRCLNGWLFKCLLPEPEVTADGIAPFSPGRAGAPPIFVICNHWNQSLERISETTEKEVIDSMRVFAMVVWHLRERDKGEMRQRMVANKDMERKVKNLEREDMRMQKEIQSLDKRIALSSGGSETLSISGNVVYQSDTSSKTSLQAGLLRIFESLDHFTSDCVKAYEELLQRSEEVVREREKAA